MSIPRKNDRVTWLVVADGERARAFRAELPGWELEGVDGFDMEQEIRRGRDYHSDRPGTTSDRYGHAQHGIEPGADAKQKQKDGFLRELAARLEKDAHADHFTDLILVSPPQTLGILRENLGEATSMRLREEITKDLAALSPHELRQWLVKHAEEPAGV